MKISIGKYPKFYTSNVHTRLMEKRYGLAFGANQTRFEDFVEKLEHGLQWFYNLTVNRFNRKDRSVKIRIDRQDVWSMYHTLALIVHPMLVELKKQKHGSPMVEAEDAPGIEDTHERWDFVLNEMIWTFDTITKEDEDDIEYGTPEYEAHDKRVKNGLRLFAVYYYGLWD